MPIVCYTKTPADKRTMIRRKETDEQVEKYLIERDETIHSKPCLPLREVYEKFKYTEPFTNLNGFSTHMRGNKYGVVPYKNKERGDKTKQPYLYGYVWKTPSE